MPNVKVAAFLTALLIGASIAPTQAVMPKAGSTCKKLGLIQISKSTKYTCIKSGARLIWNQGVRIKTPKQTPSPTPSATSRPTQTPSPNPTASSKPTSSTDIWETINWYQKTKDISLQARDNSFQLQFEKIHISPNFDKEIAEGLLEYTKLAANYWSKYGVAIPNNLEIAMFTEKDQSWFKNSIPITAPVVDNFFNHSESQIYFNGTVIVDRFPAKRWVIVYFVGTDYKESKKYLSTTSNWRTALATMATHEFQHLVQFTKTLSTNKGNLQAKLPCWFNEGMAAFFEDAFYLESPSESSSLKYLQESPDTRIEVSKIRQKRLEFLASNVRKFGFNTNSIEEWQKFIAANYTQQSAGCTSTQYGYTLGKFLHEKLYIDYGSQALVDLLSDFQNTTEFDTSFKNIYSITPQDWLLNIGLPYFLTQKM